MAFGALIWKLGRMGCAPGAGQACSRLPLLMIAVAVTGVSAAALAITLLSPSQPDSGPDHGVMPD